MSSHDMSAPEALSKSVRMAAANPAPTSRLVRIIPEVFELIANCAALHPNALAALRLTCREARNKAETTFTKKFQTLAVIPCYEPSLDMALEIAKHPKYGAEVRNVAVFVEEFRKIHEFEITPENEVQMRILQGHWDDQVDLRLSHRGTQKLAAVFTQLSSRGITPSIEFVEYEARWQHIQDTVIAGASSLVQNYLYEVNLHVPAVLHVKEAIFQSGVAPEHLVLGGGLEWAAPLHVMLSLRPVTYWSDFMSTVKSLKLVSWHDTGRDVDFTDLIQQFAAEVVASAPKLEVLSIDHKECNWAFKSPSERHQDTVFADQLLRQDLPRLKSLSLRSSRFDFSLLLEFIKRHEAESLIKLDLTDVHCLHDGEYTTSDDQPRKKVKTALGELTDLRKIDVDESVVFWDKSEANETAAQQ